MKSLSSTLQTRAQKVSGVRDHARVYLRLQSSGRRLSLSTHQRGQNKPSGAPWLWLHHEFSLHPSATYGKCAVERWHLHMQRTFFDARRSCPTKKGLVHDGRKSPSSARGRQLRLDRSPQSPFCCGTDEARRVSSGLHWRGSSQGGGLASGIGAGDMHPVQYPSDSEGEHALGLSLLCCCAMAQGGRRAQ